jgi:hypothetical protein
MNEHAAVDAPLSSYSALPAAWNLDATTKFGTFPRNGNLPQLLRTLSAGPELRKLLEEEPIHVSVAKPEDSKF